MVSNETKSKKLWEVFEMKRKLVSMVMCMALGATMLAGCGNSANTSTGNAGASNDAAAKTDDAAAADQTEDSAEAAGTESSAASGDTVTIGFAQVGHESDWRTASTDSCLSVFPQTMDTIFSL